MLMFLRMWPASTQENEVILNVRKSMLSFGLRDRVLIYARVTANTSIMELAAWIGLMIYAHTILSDGAVTATWNGVYDEMLRYSNFSSWNVSRGQGMTDAPMHDNHSICNLTLAPKTHATRRIFYIS